MSASPLRDFVQAATRILAQQQPEAQILAALRPPLASLLRTDDWLPAELAQPHPNVYCQYLLHADALERFSVVSFVWGPGQKTPVHDHTVWGLIGMLRGAEIAQPFGHTQGGRLVPRGAAQHLRPGQIEAVSPSLGDIHQVRNAFDDRTSISIHVYGANIGAVQRWVYAEDGSRQPFVSGYSNPWVPNLWDRSKDSA